MIFPVRNAKDFGAGLVYLAIGLAAVVLARDYEMGRGTRMGPAYFPTILGILLAVIGVVAIVRSFFLRGEPLGKFALKGALLVCGATVLFPVLLRGAGLIVTLIVLVLVSAYASVRFQWRHALPLALALAAFCALVFAVGLGVPVPLLGTWFGA